MMLLHECYHVAADIVIIAILLRVRLIKLCFAAAGR